MLCPNCTHLCGDDHRFCMICGTDLHPEAGAVVIPPELRPRKGSHWVPILILVLLSALGTLVYFATAGRSPTPSVQSDLPWFSIVDGELYFDERVYTGGSEVTVPAEINGEAVLYLSEACFADCESITTVHLPETLEWIGAEAFRGCTALRGLYIPDSVWFIGEMAFENCSALEALAVPNSMEYIEDHAFDSCSKLFYIFYSGSIDDWTDLYDAYITPYTLVYCEDGSFYQGGDP